MVKEGAKKVFKVEEYHGLIGTLVDRGILWPRCGVRVGAVKISGQVQWWWRCRDRLGKLVLVPTCFKVQRESQSSVCDMLGTSNTGRKFPDMLTYDDLQIIFLIHKFIFYIANIITKHFECYDV